MIVLKFLEYLMYALLGILMALISSALYFILFEESTKINGITFYCDKNISYFYTKSEPFISHIQIKDKNNSVDLEIRDYKKEKVIIPFNICK